MVLITPGRKGFAEFSLLQIPVNFSILQEFQYLRGFKRSLEILILGSLATCLVICLQATHVEAPLAGHFNMLDSLRFLDIPCTSKGILKDFKSYLRFLFLPVCYLACLHFAKSGFHFKVVLIELVFADGMDENVVCEGLWTRLAGIDMD